MNSPEQDRFDALVAKSCELPLTQAESEELAELLRSSRELRRRYVAHAQLDATLWLNAEGNASKAISAADLPSAELQSVEFQSPPSSSTDTKRRAPRFAYLLRPTPVSLTIAALFMAVLLTTMAFIAAPFYRAIAGIDQDNEPSLDSHRIVAELSAVHRAVWGSEQLEPNRGAFLHAGRRMHLEQGLAEVKFRDGATVVIEGPAKWTVTSESELRLESGQIAAKVPPKAIGFTVRAPSVDVVDLGTEFGVKLKSTETEVHVFRGEVEATVSRSQGDTRSTLRLVAGESIVWDAGTNELVREKSRESKFVQYVPTPERFTVHSTGVNRQLGQIDPHWEITKALGDPAFEPQTAVVSSFRSALPNDPVRSQWISNGHPAPVSEGEVTYTFATTFDLNDFDADTAALRIWFAVDNQVTAIRLNGTDISVPKHEYGEQTFREFMSLTVRSGFASTENKLEFDVLNADDNSHMGLRVEFVGHATRSPKRGQQQN